MWWDAYLSMENYLKIDCMMNCGQWRTTQQTDWLNILRTLVKVNEMVIVDYTFDSHRVLVKQSIKNIFCYNLGQL